MNICYHKYEICNDNMTQIQKINGFNKIHVKHQNTEMAKKNKNFFLIYFVQITVVFKNNTNF